MPDDASFEALKELYFYMVTRQMLPANYVAAYPAPGGKLTDMENCMKATRNLGIQMVKMIEQGFKYPPDIPRAGFAFGTHTK